MLNVIERAASGINGAARVVAFGAAGALSGTKRPVRILTDSGQQLNDIMHDTVEALITQSSRQTVRNLDASARHLKRSVDTNDLPSAIRRQLNTMPAVGRRVRDDLLTAMGIYRHTGEQIVELAGDTWSELRTPPKPAAPRKTATKKKTGTTRKKSTATKKKTGTTRKKSTATKKKATPRKKKARA